MVKPGPVIEQACSYTFLWTLEVVEGTRHWVSLPIDRRDGYTGTFPGWSPRIGGDACTLYTHPAEVCTPVWTRTGNDLCSSITVCVGSMGGQRTKIGCSPRSILPTGTVKSINTNMEDMLDGSLLERTLCEHVSAKNESQRSYTQKN